MKNIFTQKILRFSIVFLVVFFAINYGLKMLIGLSVPGGFYIHFVEKYLNIANWIRSSLLNTTSAILELLGLHTVRIDEYVLRIKDGKGIKIIYACLGIAVTSFWVAFVVANKATLQKKIVWVFSGVLLIWIINVLRISLVLLANAKGWHFPFGWDHHTWFNIVAYLCIFVMMYFFDKNVKLVDE